MEQYLNEEEQDINVEEHLALDGRYLLVDTNRDSLAQFLFYPGERVSTNLGKGTVIGIAEGEFWVRLDGDEALTHWPGARNFSDLHRMAEMFKLYSEKEVTPEILSSERPNTEERKRLMNLETSSSTNTISNQIGQKSHNVFDFMALPTPMGLLVLSFCDVKDVLSLSMCSTHARHLSLNNDLWRHFYKRKWKVPLSQQSLKRKRDQEDNSNKNSPFSEYMMSGWGGLKYSNVSPCFHINSEYKSLMAMHVDCKGNIYLGLRTSMVYLINYTTISDICEWKIPVNNITVMKIHGDLVAVASDNGSTANVFRLNENGTIHHMIKLNCSGGTVANLFINDMFFVVSLIDALHPRPSLDVFKIDRSDSQLITGDWDASCALYPNLMCHCLQGNRIACSSEEGIVFMELVDRSIMHTIKEEPTRFEIKDVRFEGDTAVAILTRHFTACYIWNWFTSDLESVIKNRYFNAMDQQFKIIEVAFDHASEKVILLREDATVQFVSTLSGKVYFTWSGCLQGCTPYAITPNSIFFGNEDTLMLVDFQATHTKIQSENATASHSNMIAYIKRKEMELLQYFRYLLPPDEIAPVLQEFNQMGLQRGLGIHFYRNIAQRYLNFYSQLFIIIAHMAATIHNASEDILKAIEHGVVFLSAMEHADPLYNADIKNWMMFQQEVVRSDLVKEVMEHLKPISQQLDDLKDEINPSKLEKILSKIIECERQYAGLRSSQNKENESQIIESYKEKVKKLAQHITEDQWLNILEGIVKENRAAEPMDYQKFLSEIQTLSSLFQNLGGNKSLLKAFYHELDTLEESLAFEWEMYLKEQLSILQKQIDSAVTRYALDSISSRLQIIFHQSESLPSVPAKNDIADKVSELEAMISSVNEGNESLAQTVFTSIIEQIDNLVSQVGGTNVDNNVLDEVQTLKDMLKEYSQGPLKDLVTVSINRLDVFEKSLREVKKQFDQHEWDEL